MPPRPPLRSSGSSRPCARPAPRRLLTAVLPVLEPSTYDDLADLIDKGRPVFLGMVPSTEPSEATLTDKVLTEKLLRFLDMLGLDPESAGEHLVITPACGLAGASASWTRRALQLSRQVAANLTP